MCNVVVLSLLQTLHYCHSRLLCCCVMLCSCCCIVTAVAVTCMCRCVCDIHMFLQVIQYIIVKVCNVVVLSLLQTLHYCHSGLLCSCCCIVTAIAVVCMCRCVCNIHIYTYMCVMFNVSLLSCVAFLRCPRCRHCTIVTVGCCYIVVCYCCCCNVVVVCMLHVSQDKVYGSGRIFSILNS